jgi:XTP/dITP diphosphohydrolase
VRSARFAGERATDAENNAALLNALRDVPSEDRLAQFRCVLIVIDPWSGDQDPSVVTAEGTCKGRIAQSPQGSGGFGYDPLFILDGGDGRTLAELAAEEKNAVSHRSQAVANLRPKLLKLLEDRAEATERISMIAPVPE